MTRPLKDSNRLPLLGALLANAAIYYALTKGIDLSDIKMETITPHLSGLLPGGLATVLCGFLISQLSALQKARIVFFRWNDPLPGCRAFSYYATRDPRINMKVVRNRWAPLPRDPTEQNALWYALYKQHEDSAAVTHLNRSWLFARDYACLCIILWLGLGVVGIFQMPGALPWFAFSGILLAQFLLARQAAVHHAERLVTTVIAHAAAKPA